ncbi:hypothetical protein PoB_001852400 [Plakobranchus ocellatus]|uniref:Uncharacterized protein n=1 Tax=Plakobranchus ocellatus TaxID=259542 RepID=A0AAV3ZDQ0_9GAST|nr:hypothetical protein PoB_001852400 [Plakobranchus ocellatus]
MTAAATNCNNNNNNNNNRNNKNNNNDNDNEDGDDDTKNKTKNNNNNITADNKKHRNYNNRTRHSTKQFETKPFLSVHDKTVFVISPSLTHHLSEQSCEHGLQSFSGKLNTLACAEKEGTYLAATKCLAINVKEG